MRRTLVFVYCAGSVQLAAVSMVVGQAVPAAAVDRIFASLDKPGSPGCALGVVRDGRIIYERGYGTADLEWDEPITPTTVFNIGSVSKQFVAAAIVVLAEQGKLSLDDDLRNHIPELPDYGTPITIRHLIHHTSGIRDLLELMGLAGKDINTHYRTEEYIGTLARQKELNFTPGSQHLYSNSGYVLLGIVVQRASGQSLREFADRNIFRPLGMNDTHFHDDFRMVVKRRAQAYALRNGNFMLEYSTNFDRVGSGGVNTTIRDLALWDRSFDTGALGGPAFRKTMLARGVLTRGDTLPYAFALVHGQQGGLRTVSHGGSSLGFRAHYLRFPEQRFSVITLCNTPVNAGQFAQQVAAVYLADVMKPSAQPSAVPARPVPEIPSSTADLQRYVGMYGSDELQVSYEVAVKDSRLVVRRFGYDELPLTAIGQDRFRAPIGTLEFARGAAGEVSGFRLEGGRVKRLLFNREALPSATQQDGTADRIRRQVTAIAAGDSITQRRAAIEARLRSIGLEPKLVWFDPPANSGAGRRGANIVAQLPGATSEILLLGAHYDRVSVGRGVIDNAAGVATVLELAEAFARRPLAHYTLRIALFDLEELGLLGSRAMVADSLKTPLPSVFLNFDIFGYGQAFWVGATDANRPLPRALRQAAESGGVRMSIDSIYPPSDHLSFRRTRTESYAISILDGKDIDIMLAGMRGGAAGMSRDSIRIMNIIHTPGDTLDKLDPAAVTRGVRIVEQAIRALDAAQRRR